MKASRNTESNDGNAASWFEMTTASAPIAYSTPMNGTTVPATAAMRRMPPTMTRNISVASASPDTHDGMPKEVSRPDAMLLLWGMFPEPTELSTVAAAKNTASHFPTCHERPPSRSFGSPRSMKYIGPPAIRPWSSFTRYLCEMVTSTNFVVMPTNAVAHIQKSAAGPPRKMASATPPRFPVPTVPDRAVDSAWKWDVSPSASERLWRPKSTPQARAK